MLYVFKCSACEAVLEHRCSMVDRPNALPCTQCGGDAPRYYGGGMPEVMVRNPTRAPVLDMCSMPVGWEKGNVDGFAQQKEYARLYNEEKATARRVDKQAIKGGIRKIASTPREWHNMRQRQFGKEYWRDNPVEKLKADGLYYHGD